tara:strand:- start:478 stop:636 length:159 start_codon:yes stop_codon:yes gene_type:complete
MANKKKLIDAANLQAVERMIASRPIVVDVKPAIEVVAGMKESFNHKSLETLT